MFIVKRLLFVFLLVFSSIQSHAIVDSLTLTTSLNTVCYDSCDGSATVVIHASLSTGPFRVVWRGNNLPGLQTVDTALTSDTLFNLCAGDYSVTVTDLSDATTFAPTNFSITPSPPLFGSFGISQPTCHDSLNGGSVVIINGGTGPYHYIWNTGNPADTLDFIDSVGSGIYVVNVIDANGCPFVDSVRISGPDTLQVNIGKTDVLCKNDCNGKVFANPTGGTAGYNFLWNNSDTSKVLTDLCPGKFIVTVTDVNGCTSTDSIDLLEPDSLQSIYLISEPTCHGDCDGSITSTIIGGIQPYQYQWSGYSTSDSVLLNACSGSLSATVIDANGCYLQKNLTITEPDPVVPNDSVFNSTCGVCDGVLKVFPTGGSAPYSFLWIGQKAEDTLSSIDSLCAGIYQVAIYDAKMCGDTFSINLSDDTAGIKDIGLTLSKASCNNICDGSILANPIGGTAPYSYLWNPGAQTDSVISGLCSGSFTLEVTDAAGCKRIETAVLNSNSNLTTTFTAKAVSCLGDCNGEGEVLVTGGIAPYSYQWIGKSETGNSAGSLCSGSYSVRVTDNAGCISMETVVIPSGSDLNFNVNALPANCSNSCDGTATITINMGTPPYSYNWSNGATSSSVGGLCPGSHWVEITDAKGCAVTSAFGIGSASEINSNPTITDADCGINNGRIAIAPSGGTGPYQVLWFNNTFADTINNLSSGIYTVEITDALGCIKVDTFAVSNINGPDVSFNINHESCANTCDGSIVASASGLNGPFTYLWNPFPSVQSRNSVAGLCPGIYYSTVTAGNGCQTVQPVKINAGSTLVLTFNTNYPSCVSNCDGSITSSVTGGLPPYQYVWSNASNQPAISNLCAGTYTLTVIDAANCSNSTTIELTDPSPLSVSLTTQNLLCYNSCDGSISSVVTGGKGPYTYSWFNGGSGTQSMNLCAGDYWLSVTDANGCVASDTISIGNGVPMNISFIKTAANCGLGNGSITASATGGNGIPYSYSWSTGDDSSYAGSLIAGMYYVTVEDNSGCEQTFSTALSNIGGPITSDTSISVSCFGSCDGMGIAEGGGTTAPYLIQWNDPQLQVNDTAFGLCAGITYYSITDSLGCVTYDSVLIAEPTIITSSFIATNISCPLGTDGSLEVLAQGVAAPFTFLWSNADTTSINDTLSTGTYWVEITDTTGCTISDTATLSDPIGMSIVFNAYNTSCFNSCDGIISASITGGTTPYTYLWNDPGAQTGSIATGLCPGYTTLIVTDANGCSFTDSALVTAPSPMAMTPTLTSPPCNKGTNGSISLVPSGGTPPYKYFWSNGMTGSSISGLSHGTYSVTVIDASQCVFQDSYVLTNQAPLTINFTVTNPSCGAGNGSVSALAGNGSGSYSFVWNTVPTRTTSNITSIWPGVYTVTVTDDNTGCTLTKNVIVNNSGGPALTMTHTDETCPNACDGEATVLSGFSGNLFLWDDPLAQIDSIASGLCPGAYTVKVTDPNTGCVSFDTVSISSLDYYTTILDSKAVDCFGSCTGSATAQAIGGTNPITYSWSTVPVQNGQTISGLCAGAYTVSAIDSNSCSSAAIVLISEPDSITIDVVKINDVLCAGTCTGKASLTVSGGTAPYAITWNGNPGNNVSSSLCVGINTIEVTDSKGCSKTTEITISNILSISANAVIIKPSCGEYDGSISLDPSGGKGPYYYRWSTGATTSEITGLFAGVYTVEITDRNGCIKVFTYFMNNPNAPILQFENNTVDCSGDCNGIARVNPVGGVGPFSYLWNYVPSSTRDSLTDLCAGTYIVKVTDASGCIAFGADTITEPPVLVGNLAIVSNGCGGKCEGEVMSVIVGGTTPYSYTWNTIPAQTTPNATGLCAGFVELNLLDKNQCPYTDSIEIIPPTELIIDSLILTDASCFGNTDGEAAVYFSGGTAPVGIQWSDLQTTPTAIGLTNGIVSVIITDQNGCTDADTGTIGVRDTVTVQAFVDSFICIGDNILLLASGQGTSVFQWFIDSSGVLLPIAIGDSVMYPLSDTTTFIVRGQNSSTPACTDLDTAYVIGIPPPIMDAGPDVTIDKGSFASLLASPYLFNGSYAWTPSAGLNDTAAIDPIARPDVTTLYFVYGTDRFGCMASDSVRITVVEEDQIINGFSPNGDGVNDKWILPFLEDYPTAIVEVYNRWGIEVFRSEGGYKKPWDGNYEGKLLPASSYYFVIDLFGDGSDVKTGAVTILY